MNDLLTILRIIKWHKIHKVDDTLIFKKYINFVMMRGTQQWKSMKCHIV